VEVIDRGIPGEAIMSMLARDNKEGALKVHFILHEQEILPDA
jgi:hypothetical protein